MCILQGVQCRPVSKFWQPDAAGECISEGVMIVYSETPNTVTDFAMVALAMFMLRPLQMNTATKWKLGFVFGLGGL